MALYCNHKGGENCDCCKIKTPAHYKPGQLPAQGDSAGGDYDSISAMSGLIASTLHPIVRAMRDAISIRGVVNPFSILCSVTRDTPASLQIATRVLPDALM